MSSVTNFLRICSPQYLDNMPHTKALTRASYARQKFLRFDGAIFYRIGTEAIVTIPTIVTWQCLAKIAEQDTATTDGTIRIRKHLIQLLTCNALFLLISFLRDDEFDSVTISIVHKKHTLRRQSIASGTPRLLIVSFQAFGEIVVQNGTYIWFGDAHAKGNRRHKYRNIVTNKA